MKLTNLIAIMAMLVFSLGANADTLTLDQANLSGTIVVNAEIDTAAVVSWTAEEFDDGAVDPTTLVDVDLGVMNPLSTDLCGDLTSNSTGNLGDLANITCDDTNNDLHVGIEVDGLAQVGGSTTVDVSYTPAAGDFGILEMCAATPTLGTACGNDASETGLVDQDTFTHYIQIGMPLNANSGATYTTSASNIYSGDITVDITVN